MGIDSALYATSECAANSSYTDSVLIRETSTSRLYRVSREGKHFMFKTARDNSEMLTSLIRREYELSMSFNHPHIASVFVYENLSSIGEGILMEYVDGCTLSEFLAESHDIRLRRRVWEQLLEAVAYVHRKGLRHNDLKPDNILITRSDNNVKLVDFGLSDDDAHYLLKTPGCTQGYASPELLERRALDARSDIYSLGLIMKEIFGRRYARISAKASRPSPTDRYQNVDSLQRAWAARNFPLYILVAIIILAAIMTPVVEVTRLKLRNDSLTMTIDSIAVAERERNAFRDSVYRDIELKMSTLYGELEEKLNTAQSRQQSYMLMSETMSDLPQIWQSFQDITSDQELVSSFMSHYTLLQNSYYEKMLAIINEKPVIFKSK